MTGVQGALAARYAAHTTHLSLLADGEAKRARLAKLRCATLQGSRVPRFCSLSPAYFRCLTLCLHASLPLALLQRERQG